jgi:polysaccharide biosynthesis protein PelF
MPKQQEMADVCLILEGTYPYAMGGVSTWTHELIKVQSHLKFSIVALASPDAPAKLLYELPPNVINFTTLRLQRLPEGDLSLSPVKTKEFFTSLEKNLMAMQSEASLKNLKGITDALAPYRNKIGRKLLLESREAWQVLDNMYRTTMPQVSFLDYFWSWRGLFGGLFSVLLADLPPAKTYHALCTGYAGLLLARAHLETGRSCLVTEHGIYTNERRIEIASADWIDDPHTFNLSVSSPGRDLKDFWTDTFTNYSRLCYEAASEIVTLYEGNHAYQLMDGASQDKLRLIPNGIDFDLYTGIERKEHPPTVALIGRVVSIKDIKTYIKAIHRLKKAVPDLKAYILGPTDEEPDYAEECFEMIEHLGLKDTLELPGKVNIKDYFGIIDVITLTSISEAQPLVILEAGAAGIPVVATDVGACREMITGASNEQPNLGAGGAVVPLGSPAAVADALAKLLTDKKYYEACSSSIAERVKHYYRKADQHKSYSDLYRNLIEATEPHIIKVAA